ncbi:MAG: DUF1559 domain-containing protein, partial [Pirellulales bacterium]|nr:DUF1559 domain-containing protein [Pirellulales bacterium]
MPYLFTCPHCQTKTQVEDRYSGQAGQCVTCGGEIQLPPFSGQPTQPAHTHAPSNPIRWIVASMVAIILMGCLVFAVVRFGGDTVSRLASNRDRNASMRNLEKIAEALNAYAADHGTYPPPFTTGADKKTRMHSWRVLILPYLDEEDLYTQFNLTLPWDDPDNMSVAYN